MQERMDFIECHRRHPRIIEQYVHFLLLKIRGHGPLHDWYAQYRPTKYTIGRMKSNEEERKMVLDDEPDELPDWWSQWVCLLDHYTRGKKKNRWYIVLVLKFNHLTGLRELELEEHVESEVVLCAPQLAKRYTDKLKEKTDFEDRAALELYF